MAIAGLGGVWLGATWVGYPAWLLTRSRLPLNGGSLPFGRTRRADPTERDAGADRGERDAEADRGERDARWDGGESTGGAVEATVGRVVIVCVVRDEERHLPRRLEELEGLEREGLEVEVLIVDDGSEAPVPRFGACEVLRLERVGKARAVVEGIARARAMGADVVVFCDVRQRVPARALVGLLGPFRDPAVGVVSGEVVKVTATLAGWYWRYETWVRRLESRTGSVIGATGPWYAVRREALPERVDSGLVDGLLLDDVWLPMQAVMRGWRAVVAEGAAVEDVEHPEAIERAKKARTLTGNLQLVWRFPALLSKGNPARGRYVWHKVMRLGTPLAVAMIGGATVLGAVTPGPLQGVWVGAVGVAVVGVGLALRTPKGREALGLLKAAAESWVRFARRDFRW